MITRLLLIILLCPQLALAQGFAGLGTQAEGFAQPSADQPLRFPADHASHNPFRIEWWYLTAHLMGEDGRRYGVQWTLFRSGLTAGGADQQQIWMGHAGLTTPDHHYFAERLARGGIGQAGVSAHPFEAWIDDWYMRSPNEHLQTLTIGARGDQFAFTLSQQATGPLVQHGADGYSVKSAAGQASHYYSQPFYTVEGVLDLPDGPVAVTGQGWLDREWSSQPLAQDQHGWDWFSLSFDSGEKLMGFGLRDASNNWFTSATWISATGEATPYGDGALRLTPLDTITVAGRTIPTQWRLELPERDLDITTRPVNPHAWMGTLFPYWEGPISVHGSHPGAGYLEMTGYD